MGNRYVWDELAKFLQVPFIPNVSKKYSKTNSSIPINTIQICDPKHDAFRARFMPYSYDLSRWILEYLMPAAEQREDVQFPNPTQFAKVTETYKLDPCGKLERRKEDGVFVLKETGQPPKWPLAEPM